MTAVRAALEQPRGEPCRCSGELMWATLCTFNGILRFGGETKDTKNHKINLIPITETRFRCNNQSSVNRVKCTVNTCKCYFNLYFGISVHDDLWQNLSDSARTYEPAPGFWACPRASVPGDTRGDTGPTDTAANRIRHRKTRLHTHTAVTDTHSLVCGDRRTAACTTFPYKL